LIRAHVAGIANEIEILWRRGGPVTLDLSAITLVDSAGAALLATYYRRAVREGRALKVTGVRPEVAKTLDLFPVVEGDPPKPPRPGFLERIGEGTAKSHEVLLLYLALCADVAWFGVVGLFRPPKIRWRVVAYEMANMGSRALGVVGLIAFLVGGTVALMSAAQLRQFGANIFIVDLIGVSLTRELGPLMAAIVVAGRSGSSVAAEIATMTITEEIDALRTMGLNPTRFLVLPKVIAISITQPLITVMADFLGILGGFIVAVTYLDVGLEPFIDRLLQSLFLRDLLIGILKSIVFAQLIVTIGALCGMRTRGGADAVGLSTTTIVVASIFAVVVADALFSLIFYFGG